MVLLVRTEKATIGGGRPDVKFVNGAHPRSKLAPVEEEAQAKVDAEGKEVTVQDANLQKWWGQQIPFNEIVKSGALVKKSDGTYGASGGFTRGALEFQV
jgi:chitinase